MKTPVCIALLIHPCGAFLPQFSAVSPSTTAKTTAKTRLPATCATRAEPDRHNPLRPLTHRRQRLGRCDPAHNFLPAAGRLHMSADAEAEGPPAEKAEGEEEGAGEQDPRLYSVRISRVTGIEWGTDLSFSWVYVRALQPSGAAANCGEISVGDQLIAINDINLAGAPFDAAMDAMIGLQGPDVEFTFFRGTTEELKNASGAEEPPAEITVTVKQKGKPELSLKAPSGANLRNLLTDNGINVYQSITRWTNCKGKQLCGTCIVEINAGLDNCTIRSLDEGSTLRDNPANYRLSCVTDMYDDVTVTVFPPVGAAQWTR